MIDARVSGGSQYPGCILQALTTELSLIDPDTLDHRGVIVHQRPLDANDGGQAFAVFPERYEGLPESQELGRQSPTLERYVVSIQVLDRNTDPVQGQNNMSLMTELLLDRLDNSLTLRNALAQMVIVTPTAMTKRAQRWGYQNVKYLARQLAGKWYYMSTMEFFVEVEKH